MDFGNSSGNCSLTDDSTMASSCAPLEGASSQDETHETVLSSDDDEELGEQEFSQLLKAASKYNYGASSSRNDQAIVAPNNTTPVKSIRAASAWKRLSKNVDEMLVIQDVKRPRKMKRSFTNNVQSSWEFTLTQCFLAVLLYLAVAVMAFSFVFDHFSVIDAMYFAVVTFTTIGYGDLTPTNNGARLFTCFFALSGIGFLGIALGVIGNNMIEAQRTALEKATKISKNNTMALFKPELEQDDTEEQQNSNGLRHIVIEFLGVLALLVFFALVLSSDPGIQTSGWDEFGNAIYYAIVTASTVGYGDMSPTSQAGRAWAVILIPLAVAAMGKWLSDIARYIIEVRQRSKFRRIAQTELTMEDLDVMDDDGDGSVTELEFLVFMLVAMNKVDAESITELRDFFSKLDVTNTGLLSKSTLIARAKRKLRKTDRKLELSNYKRELLRKARRKSRRGSFLFWGGQEE